MIRAFKLLALALLAQCVGCTWADRGLQAGPTPVVGFSVGAVLNVGLLLLRRPWWQRLIMVALAAYLGRFTDLFGVRMEGWHLEVVGGAMLSEIGSWFVCHGPCGRRRP